uniref:thymidylate synthase n=1 Tax=Florenciella sp. virus SA2 TaxID=3240092 RepID=A0AB39JCB0_9VIRU
MYFSLEDSIPILTTKKVAIKTCLKELLWFIKGHTNNKLLKKEKVHIWDANASKEFLNSRNLHYEEDDLGPVYGHQWRHFNAPYNSCNDNYDNCGIDQLQKVINDLKNPETRYSRRHIVSAWNPCQLDEMALPPCHIMFQFHVTRGNKLSCSLYQRSGDIGLGVPFNIFSYSALTYLIAKHCDLVPYEFIYFLGNAHIYEDHAEPLKEQIKRAPFKFPTLYIKEKKENIEDYTIDDFIIENYKYYDKINMKMTT